MKHRDRGLTVRKLIHLARRYNRPEAVESLFEALVDVQEAILEAGHFPWRCHTLDSLTTAIDSLPEPGEIHHDEF